MRILLGKGVCGKVALLRETMIIEDVSKITNYLACSPLVKSEIVVPIFKNGEFIGELDVDSHMLANFTQQDKDFLESICREVAKIV